MDPKAVALVLLALVVSGCALPGVDRGPGTASKDLVAPGTRATLVVEIDHPPGEGPDETALAAFRSAIQDATGRDAAHVQTIKDASIPSEPSRRYSTQELAKLEDTHRSRRTSGDTAALYVLYVAGGSTEDTNDGKVLGVAYGATSLAIFKGNIRGGSSEGGLLSGKPELKFVERAVLIHEFGHVAGLVNLGAPMVTPHEDPEHRGHSSNKQSVMYWAVENTRGLGNLVACTIGRECGSDIPHQFDANDKADMRAVREK